MRKFIFVAVLFLLSSRSYAQCDTIYYVVHKDLINKIGCYIEKSGHPAGQFYAIWNTYGDTSAVQITRYTRTDKSIAGLVENSNRFLKLGNEVKIPVVLTSDLMFSENFNVIQNSGKKNESIAITILTPSGFLIRFTGRYRNMKIIDAAYFQF